MGLFRKGRRELDDPRAAEVARQGAAIEAFWRWWTQEGATEAAGAIADLRPERLVDPLGQHVAAIDPGLAWELTAGSSSRHLLVVGPEGDPGLRATARRWLQAGPEPDEVWSYADTRPPVADLEGFRMEVDQVPIALDDVVLAARREGAHLEVSVYHPAFERLQQHTRTQVALLALDSVLGEADHELWIGHVEAIALAPLDPVPLTGLRSAVRDLRQDFVDSEGRPAWVVMEAHGHGGPIQAAAQVPLSPLTAPLLDTHVTVELPFSDQTEQAFPGPRSLQALQALESTLSSRLGERGRVVAHESHNGVRVLHIYVDSTTDALRQVGEVAGGWSEGTATIRQARDPGWERVRHLRV